jgi:hypothetical protein
MLDVCPENRDESKGNSIIKLWLQFIPIFEALHSQLFKGHTTKKDIPMFLICIASPQKRIIKKDISILPWSPTCKPVVPQNHTHLRQGFGGSSAGERNPPKHDRLIAEMVYNALTHSSTAKAVVSCVGG